MRQLLSCWLLTLWIVLLATGAPVLPVHSVTRAGSLQQLWLTTALTRCRLTSAHRLLGCASSISQDYSLASPTGVARHSEHKSGDYAVDPTAKENTSPNAKEVSARSP